MRGCSVGLLKIVFILFFKRFYGKKREKKQISLWLCESAHKLGALSNQLAEM